MTAASCLDAIVKAAGRPLSSQEVNDLLEELEKRIAAEEAIGGLDSLDVRVRKAADDYAAEMAQAAMIQKRNAAINLLRRLEALDTVRSGFGNDPALGVEALTVGVNKPVRGARRSAAQEQNQLRNYYLGGLMSEMEKAGHWRIFVSGTLDREIAKSLWAVNRSEPIPVNVPREAGEIAKVIAKWQEVARQDANKAGAWIKKIEGYITRQSHDSYKIRRAGYDAWKAEILPKLDMARTLSGEQDAEGFLRAVYEGLASGVHLKSGDGAPSGFKGPRNIAKKMSEERVLHFRDSDAWFDYDQRFGAGNIREALIRSLEMSAQTTGLMRRLGTNPEANLAQITDSLTRGISDPKAKQKFADAVKGKLRNQLRTVDGTSRMPVNHMGAQISAGVRSVESMAKLGAALMSQFSDLPLYGSEMRYQGKTMLGSMGEGIAGLLRGRGSAERKELGGMIGVVNDSMTRGITQRFSAPDDLPGRMSRLQSLFFKINGMTWWTDNLRRAAHESMSHRLAMNVGKEFGALDTDLQRVLRLYGIGDEQWGIIRQASIKQADGRSYVVPEALDDLGDNVFSGVLTRQGTKPTPTRIATLRREVQDQLRTYFVDRAEYAVVTPDQRTRAIMQRGTQPGTVEGEFLRFIGQFKSFTAAYTQKALGREIYGRGATTLGQAMRNGNGEMLGLAQLILWTTLFGYGSMVAKDLVKGRTPRDPQSHKTWMAAMAQGGGFGIYADFLFGEANRFGGGFWSSALGPTAGTVEDLHDVYTRVRDGDDAAAKAFRVLINNTPFANLFYTRIVMDYLFLYQVSEALNPGSVKRMEKRIEKENGQTFLLRPSATVN